MDPSKLKQKIKIFENKIVINDEGKSKAQKALVCNPFCEVIKTYIKEFKEKDIDAQKETIIFRIRYRRNQEITSDMVVEFRSKLYKIIDIDTDYQDYEWIMLKCEVTS